MMLQLLHIKLKFILMVVGVLFTSIVFGQTDVDAKLFAIWSDTTKPETDRIKAYFDRLNDWEFFEDAKLNNKWFVASDKAIELALKLDKKEYLPLFYFASSFNYALIQSDFEGGCSILNKVIESAKVANASKIPVFMAYIILSANCGKDIKEDIIINEFNKIKRTLLDSPEGIKVLRNKTNDLGSFFMQKDQYPNALRYLQESQHLSEDLNLTDAIYASNYATLSGIHLNIGNYKEAEKYIEKSLQVGHQIKDTLSLGYSYLKMAELQLKIKDKVKAQRYIDSAMYVMKNVKKCEPCYNSVKIVNAGVKNLSGNYSAALTELKEVEAFINGQIGQTDPYFSIEKAGAYLGLKRYDDAIKAINTSKKSDQRFFQVAVDRYDILIKAYEAKGDYKQALENYKKYVLVKDSMTVIRNSSETTRLELENQFTQKQLKSKLDFQTQLNKQKSTKNLLLFLGISASLLALGLYYRLRYTRKTQKILQEKNEIIEAEKQKADTALKELKSTQAQLIQSEKLASLGELTAGIAHEIQNPLNFVNNFAEVSAEMLVEMEEELDKGDTQEVKAIAADLKTNLEKINHHGQRASFIVKGMLEHSRVSTGVKEPTDLNAMADEYLRLAYHGLRAKDNAFNATIETHFDPDLPLVSVIPQDIGRVLLNLINNAFYAVNEKAKQGIEGYSPTVTVSTKKLENGVKISVQDNGHGIPESIREKIFQPFFTTKPTGQGTGLGLSLSYDIVKAHGGTLEVESTEGVGTEFIITLTI